ncbi:MAG: NAD-dependent epimerase/dehydratase family protein [Candidatus Omnitrophota bacterium]|nr:NAD-dependent epimerase/dehydratase family protein [Candidatus Omnitrophota bacterium]
MKLKNLKDVIAGAGSSIKDVMRLIDHSGLRVAYIVDAQKRLAGAISDSEIRKAILRGVDIRNKALDIANPDPIVFREEDAANPYSAERAVKRLLEKMPDSRYILVVDRNSRPKKIVRCRAFTSVANKEKHEHTGRKILVVGGAGYLGSILVRKLLARDIKVRVLDILMYGSKSVEGLLKNRMFELVNGDMRDISTIVRALSGVDAVVNLAAIVGDPACKNRPEAAIETNYLANKALAEACKYHQINRFVYASTCSVYGTMDGNKLLDENSALNPVSLYARSKIHAEEGILSLMDENFSPTILRMGTLYGCSPRMRFDLVVNTMTKTAVKSGRISVHGGGKQWRPMLHVDDAAEAYIKCLEAPIHRIRGEIFNVGSEDENYRIIRLAEIVKGCVPGSKLVMEGKANDPRNYSVSFAKIRKALKFRPVVRMEKGVMDIKKKIGEEIDNVDDPKYYNVEYSQ